MDSPCGSCPNLTLWGPDASCLWNHVLKPIPQLELQASRELRVSCIVGLLFGADKNGRISALHNLMSSCNTQEIFNTVHELPRYTAVHMRLGGMTGEPRIPFTRGGGTPMDNFISAVTCAKKLTGHHGMNTPILMITDSHKLRKKLRVWHMQLHCRLFYPHDHSHMPRPHDTVALQDNHFSGIIAPHGHPVHLDRATSSSIEEHQRTVIDLILLARASCLVTSPSGFSHHAWLAGGGKQCQRMFFNCTSMHDGPGGGPDDQLMQRLEGVGK
jgi:hypothetical protein